jgi:ribosomal protein S18 acetylase RimI-like enzyme
MTPTTDAIRTRLHRDRDWSAYALGDLDPRRAAFCEWYIRDGSVALLYREFDAPILWAAGDPAVLAALPNVGPCHLQIPDRFRADVERRFDVAWTRPMLRMALDAGAFSDARGAPEVEPLDERHEAELRALYADGTAAREDPDFFMRGQLYDGTFFGVRRDGQLVAAGGTHLYSGPESVAAIGNVYSHRAHRGRGYATSVTAAITRRLLERGTRTIALNVRRDNLTAIGVYERLGFSVRAPFWEGMARGSRPGR